MTNFKVGPAKTRDGRDAWIFEVSDKIYCKAINIYGKWQSMQRFLDGGISQGHESGGDLLPNVTVHREEFEAEISFHNYHNVEFVPSIDLPTGSQFKPGYRVKVTIEAIE